MSIDLKDSIIKKGKRQNFTFYKCHCDKCGADRGYQEKKAANRPCETCRRKRFAEEVSKKGVEAARNKNLGSTQDPEVVAKRSSKLKGRKHSEEAKKKMSDIAKSKNRKRPRRLGPRTKEEKIKISCTQRGIPIEEFDGFITPAAELARGPYKDKGLNKQCFERENYTCQICGSRGIHLNAHHLYSWKFYPELRFDLDNLVCLCKSCHRSFHKTYGNGMKTPNTKEQYEKFKESNTPTL